MDGLTALVPLEGWVKIILYEEPVEIEISTSKWSLSLINQVSSAIGLPVRLPKPLGPLLCPSRIQPAHITLLSFLSGRANR